MCDVPVEEQEDLVEEEEATYELPKNQIDCENDEPEENGETEETEGVLIDHEDEDEGEEEELPMIDSDAEK